MPAEPVFAEDDDELLEHACRFDVVIEWVLDVATLMATKVMCSQCGQVEEL